MDTSSGAITWDHHKVTGYQKSDWPLQLSKPKKLLEDITRKPVTCFAYPYGIWSFAAADSLKTNGFNTAFMVYGQNNPALPLYTMERITVKNSMPIEGLMGMIDKYSFQK